MKRKTASLLALTLAALTLLAACRPASGKPEDTKAPGSETVGETVPDTGSETKPAETTGEKEPGDTSADTKAPETAPAETSAETKSAAETEPGETEPAELTAEEVLARIDEAMDAQKEYYADMVIVMEFVTSGYRANGFYETEHAIKGLGTADAFIYDSNYSEVGIEDLGFSKISGNYESYYHGNRFTIRMLGSGEETVWTREAAELPAPEAGEDMNDLFDCENVAVEKTENGGWMILLSGCSEETMYVLSGNGADVGASVGAEVLDVTLTVFADEQFRVTEIYGDYVFEDIGEDTPTVSVVILYDDYGSVDPDELMDLDPTHYDEVISDSDAAAVLAMLDERLNADENAFALGIDQYVTVGDETVYYGENSVSRYQRTADGLKIVCYTVFGEDGENEGEIYYENGTKTVVQNGQEADLSWTEEEAEAFLLNAMLPVPVGMPSLAAKDADGYVCFFYDALDEQYAADMMGKLSSVPTDSELIVVFKTEDGAVSSVQYSIRVQGYAGETEVTLEMDYGVLFDAYDLFED
ncbi:MAG: hypothetical protein MJ070_02760 [Lachnospiraceae bacterium]|nr:hypothetical protein [Lachnospiraceae bacterium]